MAALGLDAYNWDVCMQAPLVVAGNMLVVCNGGLSACNVCLWSKCGHLIPVSVANYG